MEGFKNYPSKREEIPYVKNELAKDSEQNKRLQKGNRHSELLLPMVGLPMVGVLDSLHRKIPPWKSNKKWA